MLNFYLFNTPTIIANDEQINFSRRKALALITYLILTKQPYERNILATLLWSEGTQENARAALRRTLHHLNQTPISKILDVSHQQIGIKEDANYWCDVLEFEHHTAEDSTLEQLQEAVELYSNDLMAGFYVRNAPQYEEWLSTQQRYYQTQYQRCLSRYIEVLKERHNIPHAIEYAHRLYEFDPLNENSAKTLMTLLISADRRHDALAMYDTLAEKLEAELNIKPHEDLQALAYAIRETSFEPSDFIRHIPPNPQMLLGREKDVDAIQSILRPTGANHNRQLIIQGWPGVGKSTLVAHLANNAITQQTYKDGILWIALGEEINHIANLTNWAKAVNISDPPKSIDALQNALRECLFDKHILYIVDDVWKVEDALPYQIGSTPSATLITTRFNDVANQLSNRQSDLYKLNVLSDEQSLELFRNITPRTVKTYPDESIRLVQDLEGLPLALQVAGRLLRAEINMGWNIIDLLDDLRKGTKLLNTTAPPDRVNHYERTPPTVAALLQRSIERLEASMQEKFAILGVFAPKPATFHIDAIASIWQTDNPRDGIRTLVERGLLEPTINGRFQMHALLTMHAKMMFEA